jgi:hypothetical protein
MLAQHSGGCDRLFGDRGPAVVIRSSGPAPSGAVIRNDLPSLVKKPDDGIEPGGGGAGRVDQQDGRAVATDD